MLKRRAALAAAVPLITKVRRSEIPAWDNNLLKPTVNRNGHNIMIAKNKKSKQKGKKKGRKKRKRKKEERKKERRKKKKKKKKKITMEKKKTKTDAPR